MNRESGSALTIVALVVVLILVVLGAGVVCSSIEDPPPRQKSGKGDSDPPGTLEPRVVGRISDRRIRESSGLDASATIDGAFWTHNDSGNPPELFCLRPGGRSCGTHLVQGATNTDWEDIATATLDGRPYIFVGDIGDNAAVRPSIQVYRIPEPTAPGDEPLPSEVVELTYPDGPHDAEALLVDPATGDLYVVTKARRAAVYRKEAPFASGALTFVGRLPGRSLIAGPTGGDISPDGRTVAFVSYTGAFELPFRRSFRSLRAGDRRALDIPLGEQREAIAYRADGRTLLSTVEAVRGPILEIPVPGS
ncbi:MAG TPA: hypothetical protein VFS18_03945 [Actinomycetota bacterium]|nr:hypothetical protein [Actinomycetota bacterium]